MTKLIRLTEIMKDGDGTKRQPILINPEIIATVTIGELETPNPDFVAPLIAIAAKDAGIIKNTITEKVTFIQYRNNSGTFVAEALDEVEKLLAFDYLAAPQSTS